MHIDIVRIIVGMSPEARNLNAKDRDGQTALAAAAAFGVVEGVKILLDAGADAMVYDYCTPPRTALSRAKDGLARAETDEARARYEKIIQLFESHSHQCPSRECLAGP